MNTKKNTKTTITQHNDVPLVMTPADIAMVLGVSKTKVYEVLHSKDFPAIKIGKQYRVQRDRFFQWMNEATVA